MRRLHPVSYEQVLQTKCPENLPLVDLFRAITALLILWGEENEANALTAAGNCPDGRLLSSGA